MSIIDTIQSWLTSPLERIFASSMPHADYAAVSALRNEPVSFCLAFRAMYEKSPTERIPDLPISVVAECEGVEIASYAIGSVPLDATLCEDGAGKTGPVPDVLLPRITVPEIRVGDQRLPFYEVGQNYLLNASAVSTGGVWFTFNEEGRMLEPGERSVSVRVISLTTGEVIREHVLRVNVIDAALPEEDFLYTNWFHYDCLADYYGVELYSDAYFEILKSYVKNAVRHGQNTLLTPAFTPALDTAVGMERRNVQLVGVSVRDGAYDFDFSLLERFVRMALDCGITHIEHCHLFSQWGAASAINIYGERDGEYGRLFSCEDAADGERYADFLQAYLPAFLDFARRLGIEDRLLFHVSDEPKDVQLPQYARAYGVVRELLAGHRFGDALSHYELYQSGVVETPIVATAFAEDFRDRCGNFMLYYTGGTPDERLSNRMLTSAPWKTRILGTQLFAYRATGFLHWGYNYYYGRMSYGIFDPKIDPCGYRNMPGVSYIAYPGFDRRAYPSVREKQMRDAVSDFLALHALEKRLGREETERLLALWLGEKPTVYTLPQSGEAMLALRARINAALAE
ncbi:MAG: DUF4091 domain-containing protein [Ruminococcaceae bacterium]|nr:DUF4091 domain-containing protein [Oscillospiraceae bacterium]